MENTIKVIADWHEDTDRPLTFIRTVQMAVEKQFIRIVQRIPKETYDLLAIGNETAKEMIERDTEMSFAIAIKNKA